MNTVLERLTLARIGPRRVVIVLMWAAPSISVVG
jgi:hypothetical protein